jgi:hypothetical protein
VTPRAQSARAWELISLVGRSGCWNWSYKIDKLHLQRVVGRRLCCAEMIDGLPGVQVEHRSR